MNLLEINQDVLFYLCTFLLDDEIINLFCICKCFYPYTRIYKFNEFHSYDKVIKKSYFENFVAINKYHGGKLHNNIKKLCIKRKTTLEDFSHFLPDNIEYLKFYFDKKNPMPKGLPQNLKQLCILNQKHSKFNYSNLPKSLCHMNEIH